MNKETRIQKIQEIIDRDKANPFGKTEIPWNDDLISKEVFQIPLPYLVYNKYNGRILSRTKSLERQNYIINVESDEGKKKIEELLWDSKIDRNKKTLESLKTGQQKVGIITKDGVIIDGNRRAMLLNKLNPFGTFKAVVLDVTIEEDPLAIERLETSFQMGEDEKVGYNATEKYIKSKVLYKRLTQQEYSSNLNKHTPNKDAIKEIAKWMGKTETDVETYLNTIEVMDEYLNYFDIDGIYTQLDDREDQFLSVTKWLNTFYNKESAKAFDGYKNEDVDDLKFISFDYIRIRPQYDGKEFRNLADGKKENHFFGNKEIWKSFSKFHFENNDKIQLDFEIDYNSPNLKKHLDDRDARYFELTGGEDSFLFENINIHKERIGYNKAADQPQKLVGRALDALNAIKTRHKSFSNVEVQKQMEELAQKVFSMLPQKSPGRILSHIITLLEEFDVKTIAKPDIEEIQEKTKKIQKLGYEINKQL